MLFFDTINVNHSFFSKIGLKIMMLFLGIVWRKTMQTFDIGQEMNHPGVNQFDGLILYYQNKNVDDATKL